MGRQVPNRRPLKSLAAAARRRLSVSSVVPPPARGRAPIVAVRARGDDDDEEDDFDDDGEEFDEEELLAEFGEDFDGELDDGGGEELARADSAATASSSGKQQSSSADEDTQVEKRSSVKAAKKSTSEKNSESKTKSEQQRSDAAAVAADGSTSSSSSSSLPPAPVRGDAARARAAYARASAAARAASSASEEEQEEELELSDEAYSEDGADKGLFFDEETEEALAEAEQALRTFLRNEPSPAADAAAAIKAAKPKRLDADLAAKALDSVAARGDDAAFRAEAGIADDLFAAQEEFDDATGKVKVVPGLPPPRRWLRRVGDQGPIDAAKWAVREFKRKVDHEKAVPYMGNAYISYARLLELLSTRSVAKLTILAGGRCAIVEMPVLGFAVDVGYAAAEPGAKEVTALQVRVFVFGFRVFSFREKKLTKG